ncbi:MAG: hypothetical protein H0V73_08465, partial [Chloroflexi bacterium]|nr:hypothetical protein [Chloroflexota bacterium]
PLALELAAGWTPTLSPRAILRRLVAGRLDLAGGSDARHASVEAVVSATLELVGPRERRMFSALAIFAGGFDEPAAQAVTGDDDVIGALRNLAVTRLVEVEASPSGEPRFRLLETIRAVARAREGASDDLKASLRRYVSLYADRAVEAANTVRTSSFSAASAGKTLDDPNIQGAFAQAVAMGDEDSALRIAAALASRGMQTGILREPLARLRTTIGFVDVAAGTRSDALNAMVSLRGVLGDTVGLVADAREALALARAAGSPQRVVRTLITVGNWSGPDAAPLYEEAAELAEQTGYSWGAAIAWESLAMASWDANRPTDALRALDRAQTTHERRGDRAGVAAVLTTRGEYELVLGKTTAALEHLDRAVAILRDDPGLPFLATLAATSQATAQSLAGRTDDAIRTLSEVADRAAVAESAYDVDEWLASAAIVLQDRHPALAARCIGAVERTAAERGLPRANQRLLDAAQRRAEGFIGRHRFDVERAAGHGTERSLLFAKVARVARRESGPSRGGLLAPFGALSVREQEVLARLADGRTDREIATELQISPKTASVHVANLKAKIGVATRVEVGLYGRERLGRREVG